MKKTVLYYIIYKNTDLTKAFWVKAQPPSAIHMPEMSQNGLLTVTLSFAIEEYIGLDTKVSF